MNHLLDYASLLESPEPPKSLKLASEEAKKRKIERLKKMHEAAAGVSESPK